MIKQCVGIFMSLLALDGAGCSNDISLNPSSETYVVVDSFTQNEGVKALDIVGIVDTSCSMADGDIQRVANGMANLREDVATLTSDYQFIFMTAENSPQVSGPYDSSVFDIDLKFAVTTLPYAWSDETGFAAIYEYVTFQDHALREDDETGLLIFMFSDEDDQSLIEASDLSVWLDGTWPEKLVDVVPVVPSMLDTEYEAQGMESCGERGDKYIELANMFGKDALDLCNEDWDAWLSDSSFLTAQKDSIALSELPIISSIVVYIDRIPTNEWTYDVDSNTVMLNDVPDYGVLVEVGYDVVDD